MTDVFVLEDRIHKAHIAAVFQTTVVKAWYLNFTSSLRVAAIVS